MLPGCHPEGLGALQHSPRVPKLGCRVFAAALAPAATPAPQQEPARGCAALFGWQGRDARGWLRTWGAPGGGGHRSALRFWAAPTLSHGQVAIPGELPGSPLLCCQTPTPKPALRGGPALYPPLNPPGLRHPPGSGGTGDLNPLRPCGARGRAGPGGENRGRFWGGGWGGGPGGRARRPAAAKGRAARAAPAPCGRSRRSTGGAERCRRAGTGPGDFGVGGSGGG